MKLLYCTLNYPSPMNACSGTRGGATGADPEIDARRKCESEAAFGGPISPVHPVSACVSRLPRIPLAQPISEPSPSSSPACLSRVERNEEESSRPGARSHSVSEENGGQAFERTTAEREILGGKLSTTKNGKPWKGWKRT